MTGPYLLLIRTDLQETPAETARRRASALRRQAKRAKVKKTSRAELVAMNILLAALTTKKHR